MKLTEILKRANPRKAGNSDHFIDNCHHYGFYGVLTELTGGLQENKRKNDSTDHWWNSKALMRIQWQKIQSRIHSTVVLWLSNGSTSRFCTQNEQRFGLHGRMVRSCRLRKVFFIESMGHLGRSTVPSIRRLSFDHAQPENASWRRFQIFPEYNLITKRLYRTSLIQMKIIDSRSKLTQIWIKWVLL